MRTTEEDVNKKTLVDAQMVALETHTIKHIHEHVTCHLPRTFMLSSMAPHSFFRTLLGCWIAWAAPLLMSPILMDILATPAWHASSCSWNCTARWRWRKVNHKYICRHFIQNQKLKKILNGSYRNLPTCLLDFVCKYKTSRKDNKLWAEAKTLCGIFS